MNPGARFCVSVCLDLWAPLTNLPNPRRKKKSGGGQLREHVTGCARSEGYYAISRKEKDVYLDLDLPEQVIREVENVDTSVRAAIFHIRRVGGEIGRVAKKKKTPKNLREGMKTSQRTSARVPLACSAVV